MAISLLVAHYDLFKEDINLLMDYKCVPCRTGLKNECDKCIRNKKSSKIIQTNGLSFNFDFEEEEEEEQVVQEE